MKNKIVVITGATSGIGRVAAEALAAQGARLVIVARDRKRGESTLAALAPPSLGDHRVIHGDLSTLAEMRRIGAEIAASEPKIDVLINNAGAVFNKREATVDGLEPTFALNHMSYFLMTELLRPSLSAAPSARIVSTASRAHRQSTLDCSDLQGAFTKATFMQAYAKSKLCNILWTRELARRLHGSNITANAFHPGFVASRFGDNMTGGTRRLFGALKSFATSPEKGADTLIYLASSPEVEGQSGGYWVRRRRIDPSTAACDSEAAARLWAESDRLTYPHAAA
jgi:NAD(P)-dependent dehydrogenase (short-subunit alcohol dehydrogenase family)